MLQVRGAPHEQRCRNTGHSCSVPDILGNMLPLYGYVPLRPITTPIFQANCVLDITVADLDDDLTDADMPEVLRLTH